MANRFQDYWHNDRRPLPTDLDPRSLNAEEALFLKVHARDRLIAHIADAADSNGWIEAIAAGFANLLQHADMEDHHRIYVGSSQWHVDVRPPSVIASQLLMFLGRLSVANPTVYDGCMRRGSVQGFILLTTDLHQWKERATRGHEE